MPLFDFCLFVCFLGGLGVFFFSVGLEWGELVVELVLLKCMPGSRSGRNSNEFIHIICLNAYRSF